MRRSLLISYVGLNVACLAAVLYAGHHVKTVMAVEQRTTGDVGDGLSLLPIAGPAFLVALALNAWWLSKALRAISHGQGYNTARWVAGMGVLWVLAIGLAWYA